ncbi:MAG: ABC transporter ATP-binding protein/permease [Lachnospiraceae bacterium]|nr:ABC transporter ATP-binding protein/permease [Lachnospiraceae bacterium]
MEQNRSAVMKKILRYIRKYWFFLLGSLLFAVITVTSTLFLPILTGQAVDCAIGPKEVDFEGLLDILWKMAALIGITALAQYLMSLCNNKLTYCVVRDIRRDAFQRLQILPLKYADNHPTGEIVSKVIADVDQFADGLLMGFTQLFTGIMTILGTLGFMISISVPIALVVVIITPVSLIVAAFIAKNTYAMFQRQSAARSSQTAYIEEMITNQRVVTAFSKQADVLEGFEGINAELAASSMRATFFSSLTNPSTRFVNGLVYTAVAITGAFAVLRGSFTIGRLTTFLSYANQYTKPFNEISGVMTELQNAIACAQRVFEIIEEEPEVASAESAVNLTDVSGKVELKNVDFSYVKERPLIEDLNLDVAPGQRVAIVGPTGSGKTTLINLLMRFYDVNDGEILISDHEIRNVTRKSLRENFGMVLQETWLKSGSILDNLRMARPDATEEEVMEAAKAAHAHGFIRRMPDGYHTVIGEDGGNLSQGQKQLLCIARVMLALPPMLILDEATSSIDTRTELKIQNAFALMMKGRTSFIVAHRLSTIKEADVILVLKDGHIVEQGNHESLLAQHGFYANLYESQFEPA